MKYLTFIIIFIPTIIFAQDFNLDIHNTSLSDYIKMEESFGGELIANKIHYASKTQAQPVRFQRKEELIPDLISAYFVKKKDSSMSEILYEWDVSNFEKKDNNQKSEEFERAMIDKYKSLKISISGYFGEPKVKYDYLDISVLDPEGSFIESSKWYPNDSTEIDLSIAISNFYQKKGRITINPVHRISLHIKNTKLERVEVKELEPIFNIEESRQTRLDKLSREFIASLILRNATESIQYFSKEAQEVISDEQMAIIMNFVYVHVDDEKDLNLILSDTKIGPDGNEYGILIYTDVIDHSNPPESPVVIQINFDENDEVVGIQPSRLPSRR